MPFKPEMNPHFFRGIIVRTGAEFPQHHGDDSTYIPSRPDYSSINYFNLSTNSVAANTNSLNRGCGFDGRDKNSGWN